MSLLIMQAKRIIIICASVFALSFVKCALGANPLDTCVYENRPFTAGEIVSFALEWTNPDTGLVPTIIAKTKTKNPYQNFSYSYTQAIVHEIFLLAGKSEEAQKTAELFRERGEKRQLPNAFNYLTGLCEDSLISSGPNAYWGISFLRQYQISKDQKWLEAAKRRAEFLMDQQEQDGGIRKSPFWGSAEYFSKSTEENLDTYAFLDMLFRITAEKQYRWSRDRILAWLARSGVYNKNAGYFTIGTTKGIVNYTYSCDVNALALIILGSQILNANQGEYVFGGEDTTRKILGSFEKAKVSLITYKHPCGKELKDVTGFDFTDAAGRVARQGVISPEFTSQVILAYLVMAKDAKEKGNVEEAKRFSDEARFFLNELAKMAVRTGNSVSLPYASEKNVRRFAFDNWLTPEAEANISGVWAVFPLAGYNPFAEDGFNLRDTLKDIAPWIVDFGQISVTSRPQIPPLPEKIISEVELIAAQEAPKIEDFEKPIVYYEVLYKQVEKDAEFTRKRAIEYLMTSYSAWVGGVRATEKLDYDIIGIDSNNNIIKKKISEIPESLSKVINEEYVYYDEDSSIKWHLASKYNLNIDVIGNTYYAFEMDEDYNIVRQFRTEEEVPKDNREQLKDPKSQYQSAIGLSEGHLIARYFIALEVDKDLSIVKAYEKIDDLPGVVSKIPIDKETYLRYLNAKGAEKENLLAAGIIPGPKGSLAVEERGMYYTYVLGLDETRRLRIAGVTLRGGNEIIMGTRSGLGNWRINETTKLNALKYEQGLIDGMVIKPHKSILGKKPSTIEPLWIYLGREVIEQETQEFKKILRELLKQIKSEKDAQIRQEFIERYDQISSDMVWYDNEGYIHVIYYGAKTAQKRLDEFKVAKQRAEVSLRKYESILGRDEKGRDLRDAYGNVWLKVINKTTGYLLYVETYDIAGNLVCIFAKNVKIDPLTKKVSADTRADIQYEPETYQPIGSHTYLIDEDGNWIADISESIFRGYTNDKKYLISEIHKYMKDSDGRIIYDEKGKVRYTTKIEYYTPEGDIVVQIIRNIISIVKYAPNHQITRQIYLDTPGKVIINQRESIDELTAAKVWVRRYKSADKIISFRDALIASLSSLAHDQREKTLSLILSRLAAEKKGIFDETFILEEVEVINNLSEDHAASGEAAYTIYYEPDDILGRPMMIVRGTTIEIPVSWIAESEVPEKTLCFNLSGELVSIAEVEKAVRPDTVLKPYELEKISLLGISADTLLPRMVKRIFRIVTGPDGEPHFTNSLALFTVSYMIPDDILGRELANIKFVLLHEETILYPASELQLEKNIFKEDTITETRQDNSGKQRRRTLAKRDNTVIYEWYKEGMAREQLQAGLIENALLPTVTKGKLKELPKTYDDLIAALRKGKIKKSSLLVSLRDLKEALDNLQKPPFGTLPGYHLIRANGEIGDLKYFIGFVEYPRIIFSHPTIKVPYEPQVPAFSLADGPVIKGVKYGVINSDYAFYDVHSFTGQLVVLERPFIILHLMNILPIQGGRQTEYYDPLQPYSHPKPIKIERDSRAGTQPEGEKPGRQLVAVFIGKNSVYHRNGWQTQAFLERRPFDIDHWIRSDYEFDENGVYKYKKEHIESNSIYLLRTIKWQKPFIILAMFAVLMFVAVCACHRRLIASRTRRLNEAEIETKKNIRQTLNKLEEWLISLTPAVSRQAIEKLKMECAAVYEKGLSPRGLYESVAGIFRPLIETRFSALGASSSDYSSSIEVLLNRISDRIGKKEIELSTLFPLEIEEFSKWSEKFGHHFDSVKLKTIEADELLIAVLFRIIFDESMEFRAAVSSFRYFLFDKALDILSKGRKEGILVEIKADVWVFLEALRPGYDKKLGLTKNKMFTYEDMKDIFEGKKPGFIESFSALSGWPKEEKLKYLASQAGRKHTADILSPDSYLWLKTFLDVAGLLQFFKNLKRFWAFFIPLILSAFLAGTIAFYRSSLETSSYVIAKFLSLALSPLFIFSPHAMATLIDIAAIIGFGVLITSVFIKRNLGNYSPVGLKPQENRIVASAVNKFWVMFISVSYLWGIFSSFIIMWTVKIISKLTFVNIWWGVFINTSAFILTFVFILSSFFSLFYIMIAFFGYLQGKREGVGQVIDWPKLRKNFEASKKRFKDLIPPFSKKTDTQFCEMAWRIFWDAMIRQLYDYCILNDSEFKVFSYCEEKTALDLSKPPRAEEAKDRIYFYINSWLMDMPRAESWNDLPSLTVMITAFNEPVSFSFDELNACDRGATMTRLNRLISSYLPQWEEFVDRLQDSELGQIITRQQLKSLFGLKKLPQRLTVQLKEKIARWANLTVQCVEKTAGEAMQIRDSFKFYARLYYPSVSEIELEEIVDKKIQIFLNYEGYHKPFTRDSDRVAIRQLMRRFPKLEVYWDAAVEDCVSGEADRGLHRFNPHTNKVELIQSAPFTTPIKKGKPSGLNQAISFVRGETTLFFDANCSVRIEDALKLPVALSEFTKESRMGEILFSEYIFNKDYSWISQAIGFNEGTFVTVTQRTLNIFNACAFYGHSAIIKTDMITAFDAFPQDYISEDILLATSFWNKGIRTTHKEYIRFGKGRETSFFTSLIPLTKWAMGSSELAIGRAVRNILESSNIHLAQKFMLMFGFSFFYQTPLMFIINFLYLWFMLCWGINGFMAVPYPIIFAMLGLLFNQAITVTGITYLLERYGIKRFLTAYFKLVLKNFFFYASVIPAYAFGFLSGLKGKGVFIISPKGWNLGHMPLKAIWGEKRDILRVSLVSTILGLPFAYILVALKTFPLWIIPFIPFLPFVVVVVMCLLGSWWKKIRLPYLKNWRDEITPEGDITKVSVIKIQIIYAIVLLVFTCVGFVMWGLIFSSLAVKLLFLLSLLYISTTLSFVLMPLLAHSQPILLFKSITLSRFWNYIIIPILFISVILGINSILSRPATVVPEVTVYTLFGLLSIVAWVLLKWKLNAFVKIHRWLDKNIASYRTATIVERLELMDGFYFSHQELLQTDRKDEEQYLRFLRKFKFIVIITISVALVFYFISELNFGKAYSPWWLWFLVVTEVLFLLILNIRHTLGSREYLKAFLCSVKIYDFNNLNENTKAIEDIWKKLKENYRNKLMKIYDNETGAKESLVNFMLKQILPLIKFPRST